MENLKNAVSEVTGLHLAPRFVRKYFFNVYRFLLYQDTPGLLETLSYRSSICKENKQQEKYLVFKFMLCHLRNKHPRLLSSLCPVKTNKL